MLFVAGEAEMEDVEAWLQTQPRLGHLEHRRLWRKSGVQVLQGLREVDCREMLLLCTDWVSHGLTVPGVTAVIITLEAWRVDADELPERRHCSEGEIVNQAGRGGRTNDSDVYICGLCPRALLPSPTLLLHQNHFVGGLPPGRRLEVCCAVLGTRDHAAWKSAVRSWGPETEAYWLLRQRGIWSSEALAMCSSFSRLTLRDSRPVALQMPTRAAEL